MGNRPPLDIDIITSATTMSGDTVVFGPMGVTGFEKASIVYKAGATHPGSKKIICKHGRLNGSTMIGGTTEVTPVAAAEDTLVLDLGTEPAQDLQITVEDTFIIDHLSLHLR